MLEIWLFLTIAFAVIAFGATPAWARSVFGMAAFIAAIAALWICRRRPDPGRLPVLVAWSILLVVPLLQLTPLPAAVQRVISPVHAQLIPARCTPPPASFPAGPWNSSCSSPPWPPCSGWAGSCCGTPAPAAGWASG